MNRVLRSALPIKKIFEEIDGEVSPLCDERKYKKCVKEDWICRNCRRVVVEITETKEGK